MARDFGPQGIIDIGSNSVRFVAYAGTARVPSILFNEKVLPQLGKGVDRSGRLDEAAMERTLASLARFARLGRDMGLGRLQTVATAAVRDAENGAEFLDRVRALGLQPRLVTGGEEAELAAYGVISSIPGARGLAADLGGGSLELTAIGDGQPGAGVSLPLGVLRAAERSPRDDEDAIRKGLKKAGIDADLSGATLYLVGGSFRALARIDLHDCDHPLPIAHQHVLERQRVRELARRLTADDIAALAQRASVSSGRLATVPAAVALLQAMIEVTTPRQIMVSAFGLREGLLYRDLPPKVRAEDPLLAAALEVGERLGRFGDHGAVIDQWIDPLFPDDDTNQRRLRLAACLMSDSAWNAHPDFRAERAVDMAIHGNWVGIDGHGRALLGRTLSTAFGGDHGFNARLADLLGPVETARAEAWGRAIRLVQRLSGGTERALRRASVAVEDGVLVLRLPRRERPLAGEAVERRLGQLAKALGLKTEIRET